MRHIERLSTTSHPPSASNDARPRPTRHDSAKMAPTRRQTRAPYADLPVVLQRPRAKAHDVTAVTHDRQAHTVNAREARTFPAQPDGRTSAQRQGRPRAANQASTRDTFAQRRRHIVIARSKPLGRPRTLRTGQRAPTENRQLEAPTPTDEAAAHAKSPRLIRGGKVTRTRRANALTRKAAQRETVPIYRRAAARATCLKKGGRGSSRWSGHQWASEPLARNCSNHRRRAKTRNHRRPQPRGSHRLCAGRKERERRAGPLLGRLHHSSHPTGGAAHAWPKAPNPHANPTTRAPQSGGSKTRPDRPSGARTAANPTHPTHPLDRSPRPANPCRLPPPTKRPPATHGRTDDRARRRGGGERAPRQAPSHPPPSHRTTTPPPPPIHPSSTPSRDLAPPRRPRRTEATRGATSTRARDAPPSSPHLAHHPHHDAPVPPALSSPPR